MTSFTCQKCDCVKGCQSNPSPCPIWLAECIASGQVSAAQIEAHRVLDSAIAQPTIKEPLKVHVNAEQYMLYKYGAFRGHFAWREIQSAYAQGQLDAAIAQPTIDIKEFTDRVFRMVDGVKFELEQNKLDAAISARLDLEHFLLKHIAQPEQPAISEFTIADLAIKHLGSYAEKDYDFAVAVIGASKVAQPEQTALQDATDAQRYRRIRNGPYSDRHGDVYAMTFQGNGDVPIKREELDRIVDAALALAQPKDKP